MGRTTIHALALSLLFFYGCRGHSYIDPFWKINLDSDKSIIINDIKEKTSKGEINNCVFYFEKTSYIKSETFDSRVTFNLNSPVFFNNKLDKLQYTFSVDFKNEKTQQFNEHFYHYFICEMENVYGKLQKDSTNDEITLTGILRNRKILKIAIFKESNRYSVLFQNSHQ